MRPGSKKEDKIGKIDLERKGQKKERDIFEANTVIEQKENLKASIKKENENEELHHAKTHEHAHEEKRVTKRVRSMCTSRRLSTEKRKS